LQIRTRKQSNFFIILLVLTVVCIGCAQEETERNTKEFQTEYERIKVLKVAGDLERPWSIAFLPDGRKMITEGPGRLNILENGELTVVNGTPEVNDRMNGLLDVVLHPDYEENGWIYLTFSRPGPDDNATHALVRGRLNGHDFVDMEEIFVQNRYSDPCARCASRLAWDSEGYLYMSIRDIWENKILAQDLSDHSGSILRLNDDGSVPADNPFFDDPDAAGEIYSYGHRAIQGLVIDQVNNEIWATEHGPRGGDELNYIERGNNYGWPVVSLGRSYSDDKEFEDEWTVARHKEGMVDPVYELLPTHAPSGLALVTADNFPSWQGNLLSGGLAGQRIRRLVIKNYTVIHDEELLLFEIGRIRDIREGPDGNIYILTDGNPGALYMMEPA